MTALLVLLVAAVVLAAVGKVHGAFLTHQRSSPAAWHEVNARAHKDCACLLHTDKRKQTKKKNACALSLQVVLCPVLSGTARCVRGMRCPPHSASLFTVYA